MKLRWLGMVSEQELTLRTGQQTIIERLRINRWRLYSYVLRMPDQIIPKQALRWRPVCWRRVGRPKKKNMTAEYPKIQHYEVAALS